MPTAAAPNLALAPVSSFQAQDESGDISQFVAIEHQVWHRTMRSLQSRGKGYGRHSWDIRNRFEAWRRGIGRANLPLVDRVTFDANLLR